jgi:glycine cleavage system aminomethyltransferase T
MSKPDPSFINSMTIHPVYIGSNVMSPFHDCYANDKTILRLAAGRCFAHYNGENIESAYWALRQRAALFDVPERPIEVSGPEAVAFLDLIFTRKSGSLKVGSGHYTLACTYEGGLFMDGILFRLENNKFWFVQPDGELDSWLLAHSHNFEITIADPKSRVLQLQGPNSFQIINAATEGSVDENTAYFSVGFHTIGGQQVLISRTGWSGELGYEIYTLGNDTDYEELFNTLMRLGVPRGMLFSSMQALNIRRIEAGILDSGSDFDISMTPFEAELSRFVDAEKANFVGRDALSKRKQNKCIVGVICPDYIPKAKDLVLDGNEIVGFISTGAYSPEFKAGIGFARINKTRDKVGSKLQIVADNESDHLCEVVTLPFYDRSKVKPRALKI